MNRYRIVRPIKKGGMAELFEAIVQGDVGFQRRVALKRMLPELASDSEFEASFVDEAKIAAHLHHANIVAVLDFGVMDDLPFQVLELVDGLDLAALELKLAEPRSTRGAGGPALPGRDPGSGEKIGDELALHIVVEIAHALEYAHTANDELGRPLEIVHRDVSPENILISWAGDVKLGDFGIARSLERRAVTRADVARGKRAYMAPEQARAELVDARADLFALGCVLHRLATGKSPIEDDAVRRELLAGVPAPLDPRLPEDLAKIIARAIEPNKRDRYANAAAMRADCVRALAKRIEGDGRAILRALMAHVKPMDTPNREPPKGNPFLMLDLVLREQSGDLRRFESVIAEPPNSGVAKTLVDASLTTIPPISENDAPPSTRTRHTALTPITDSGSRITIPPAAELGTVIGPYRIETLIGQGGFAGVYRAVHLVLGMEVALKVLHGGFEDTSIPSRRFAREISVLEKLDHPCIARVRESGVTEDGRPWLAMELLRGRTIHSASMNEGPFELSRVWTISRDIAAGLAVAHRNGIVHRDLKPRNVMLVRDEDRERARIVDFGIAVLLDPEAEHTRFTQAGGRLGTPRWMAPEQIRDPSSVGPATDLYALGLLMYTMVAGAPPFDCPEEQVIQKHLEELPPPLQAEAGDLWPLIASLLAKEIADRPENAEAVIEALDRLELGQAWNPTAITRPRSRHHTVRAETVLAPPPLLKRKTSLAPFAVVVLFLVMAAGLLVAQRRRSELASAVMPSQPEAPSRPVAAIQPAIEARPEPEEPPGVEAEKIAVKKKPALSRPAKTVDVPPPSPPKTLSLEELRHRLVEVKRTLSARTPELGPERARALERRWLDTRTVLKDELSPEELRRLDERIRTLEHDINAE